MKCRFINISKSEKNFFFRDKDVSSNPPLKIQNQ